MRCLPFALLVAASVSAVCVGTWSLYRWLDGRPSCMECSSVYYTAAACALGGQPLHSAGWEQLFPILHPGNSVRKELESLLKSDDFISKARCPRWSHWDDKQGFCATGQDSKDCPKRFKKDNSDDSACSPNMYFNTRREPFPNDTQTEHFSLDSGLCLGGCYEDGFLVEVLECSQSASQAWRLEPDGSDSATIRSSEGFCLAVDNNTWHIHVEPCVGSPSQLWTWRGGRFRHSSGFCLTAFSGPGPRVGLRPCSSQDQEQLQDLFTFDQGEMRPRHMPNHCLDSTHGGFDDAGFGGVCTCPDGNEYMATDVLTSCRTMACVGGAPGICSPDIKPSDRGAEVTCKPDFAGASNIERANPSRDSACWTGEMPLFVWPRFVRSCSGFAPRYIEYYSTSRIMSFNFAHTWTNPHPAAVRFGDFGVFYDIFYSTGAGDMCRERFGQKASQGVLLHNPPSASLTHSVGTSLFQQRTLLPGTQAWLDRDYQLAEVPNELVGSVLFAGLFNCTLDGTLSLTSDAHGTVYMWGETWNREFPSSSGGVEHLNWTYVDGMKLRKGSPPENWMQIYKTSYAGGTPLDIPYTPPWVGGVAFRPK